MRYKPTSSSASMDDAAYALIEYFGYQEAEFILKEDYANQDEYINLLLAQLDNEQPVLYAGANSSGVGAHAFVLDGYTETSPDEFMFHINWGWSNAYDDYYYLNDLTPDMWNFNYFQQAVLIEPAVISAWFEIETDIIYQGESIFTEPEYIYYGTGTCTNEWDFGDGQTSTSYLFNHWYNSPGQYEATLTMTDGTHTDVYAQTIIIKDFIDIHYANPDDNMVWLDEYDYGDIIIFEDGDYSNYGTIQILINDTKLTFASEYFLDGDESHIENTILNNISIYADNSKIEIVGLTFDNASYHVFVKSQVIIDNIVMKNCINKAIYLNNSNGTINNSSFYDNIENMAIYANQSRLFVENCIFDNNIEYTNMGVISSAGAITTGYSDVYVSNSLFTNNAGFNCGDFSFCYGNYHIKNCVVYNNDVTNQYGYGAIEASDSWGEDSEIKDCIIYNNEPCNIGAVSDIIVNYSDIGDFGIYPGVGNINIDPLFVDASNDDFHLQDDSP